MLDREIGLEPAADLGRIKAWTLDIEEETFGLEPGYSGSPVVAQDSGNVLAVVSHRRGKSGESGLAISIAALSRLWRACPPLQPPPRAIEHTLALFSFPPTGNGVNAPHIINWYPTHFKDSLPTLETWQTTLLPTLARQREELGESGVQRIRLYAKAHLSVGLAFGYVFRKPTSIQLEIEQEGENSVQWWKSDDQAAPGAPLIVKRPRTDSNEGDITLELSISRDVSPTVESWIAQAGLPIQQRIAFTPASGPGRSAIPDSSHALAAVRQIRDEVLTLRDHQPGVVLHIFGAMPIALAVLLGRELNRCGPMQCYEFVGGSYQPSCLLE
jgi:hypothetical protein